MKYYIITSKASSHILPATFHLLDKYGPAFERKIVDLGKNDISRWTIDIYEQMKEETDEYIVFSLDDYLPIDHWEQILVAWVMKHDFVRYELGYGAQYNHLSPPKLIDQGLGANLFCYNADSRYRVSCQTSIWKTEILLKLLSEKARNPWEFEVKGDIEGPVLFTTGKYGFRWIEESALSKRWPDKINILGLRPDDVNDLIDIGALNPDKLQYGMARESNPIYVPGCIPFNPGPKYDQFY